MRKPKYRRHTTRDLAFYEWEGKRHYLPGPFGSDESRQAYQKAMAAIAATPREPRERRAKSTVFVRPEKRLTRVFDVCVAFLDHAERHYPQDVSGTPEYVCCQLALERLNKLHGRTLAADFGPLRMKQFQQQLVDLGLSRRYINMTVNRVRRAFKWAVSEEMIDVDVWQALRSVDGLRKGRTEARELDPRQPVPWSQVEPILPHLSVHVARMVELQWRTGVRPQSVIEARAEQFDLDERVWRPRHKTEYRGHVLVVPLGPRACELAADQIADAKGMDYLFSPIRAGGKANIRYGLKYTTGSYRQAVHRAQRKAGIMPAWSPHQLRHGRATEVRQRYGLEAAQAVLGHASIDATQVYASRLFDLARRVSDETG